MNAERPMRLVRMTRVGLRFLVGCGDWFGDRESAQDRFRKSFGRGN